MGRGCGCGGYPKVVVLAAATSTMMSVAGVVHLFVATKETTMAASTRTAAFELTVSSPGAGAAMTGADDAHGTSNEDGPRRSTRERRPNARTQGPEWA